MATVPPAARSVVRAPLGFWTGFTYPFRGMKVVFFEHPGLVRYWAFPILITVLVFCLGSWATWTYGGELLDSWWQAPTEDGWLAGVTRFFHAIASFVLSLALWAASLVVLMFLTNVIAAPFNGALSTAVERIKTGQALADEGFGVLVRDIGRTIVLEAVKMLLYLCVMVPLFILQCGVPGFGSILVSVVGFVFTAWYWGLDYTDWPAERRGWTVGHRFSNARARFWTWFGFGAGVWLFLFVPFVNLLFMPAAVAGGTLLFLDQEGAAPDPTPTPSAG